MAFDHDLAGRVYTFVVALKPLAAEARAPGHHPEFWSQGFNAELARLFAACFDERAGEFAVTIRLFEQITGDVPDGLEVNVVKRRTTKAPKGVEFERAVKNLLVARSNVVAIAKILTEKDRVIVRSCRPPTVLASHEVGHFGGSALSESLEESLDVA